LDAVGHLGGLTVSRANALTPAAYRGRV